MRHKQIRHGEFKGGRNASSEYWVWVALRQRCQNPKCWAFPLYGGRGISVCPQWEDYRIFLSDMGRRPGNGYWIERVNVNGNYEPSNCCWATIREQSNNRRNSIRVDGLTLHDIAANLGMTYSGVYTRLVRGWDLVQLGSEPKHNLHLRSTNRWIDFAGKRLTLTQWSREIGISVQGLASRLRKMPIESALQMPPRKRAA